MTLETLLPFLLVTSLMGCMGLLAFLLGRVSSKKHFLVASLALALALTLNLFYGVANHYTGVGINEAALFQIGKGIDLLDAVRGASDRPKRAVSSRMRQNPSRSIATWILLTVFG